MLVDGVKGGVFSKVWVPNEGFWKGPREAGVSLDWQLFLRQD